MTVTDPEQFTNKNQSIAYIEIFIEQYNQRNQKQVYEIHRIVALKKICSSTTKHLHNLSINHIVKISSILHIVYIIPKNQKIVFYINNYIYSDQFTHYTLLIG